MKEIEMNNATSERLVEVEIDKPMSNQDKIMLIIGKLRMIKRLRDIKSI